MGRVHVKIMKKGEDFNYEAVWVVFKVIFCNFLRLGMLNHYKNGL